MSKNRTNNTFRRTGRKPSNFFFKLPMSDNIWLPCRTKEAKILKSHTQRLLTIITVYEFNSIDDFFDNFSQFEGFLTNNNNDEAVQNFEDNSNNVESNFEEDFVNAHNEYRSKHGAEPLEVDNRISQYSQQWANNLASTNTLVHSQNSPYGENLYTISSSDPNMSINGRAAVDAWYDEIQMYPFGQEPYSLEAGHFSQLVWKNSKKIGVGVARNNYGGIFVVANYLPAGNVTGQFTENVFPPEGSHNFRFRILSQNFTITGIKTIFKSMDNFLNQVKTFICTVSNNSDEETADNLERDGSPKVRGTIKTLEKEILDAHNSYRHKHGVGPLKLSKSLSSVSQTRADNCASTDTFGCNEDCEYGENVYHTQSSELTNISGAAIVDSWYEQSQTYQFGEEPSDMNACQFSQLIWKNSNKIGIGIGQCDSGIYVVVNYSPAGNISEEFIENVPPLIDN